MREKIVHLLLALSDNRGDEAAEVLIGIGDPLPEFDRTSYVRGIAALIARNYDLAVGEIVAGRVLFEIINISYQKGIRMPAELTFEQAAAVSDGHVSVSNSPVRRRLAAGPGCSSGRPNARGLGRAATVCSPAKVSGVRPSNDA